MVPRWKLWYMNPVIVLLLAPVVDVRVASGNRIIGYLTSLTSRVREKLVSAREVYVVGHPDL